MADWIKWKRGFSQSPVVFDLAERTAYLRDKGFVE